MEKIKIVVVYKGKKISFVCDKKIKAKEALLLLKNAFYRINGNS